MTSLRLEQVQVNRTPRTGNPVTLLRDITIYFPAHAISCLIGPSGSGKSTLLRLLNRLDDPSSGTIYYNDRPLPTYDPAHLRRSIGMVLQKPCMFSGTVQDNLLLPFTYQAGGSLPSRQMVEHSLSQVHLSLDMLDRDAHTLSLGQQQRVSLARTLLMEPQVLLLDEPTSALDPPTADALGETLTALVSQHNLTVIVVTHDLRLVRQISDHSIYLEQGRLLEQGGRELLEHPRTDQLRRFLTEPPERRHDE